MGALEAFALLGVPPAVDDATGGDDGEDNDDADDDVENFVRFGHCRNLLSAGGWQSIQGAFVAYCQRDFLDR